MISRTMSVPIPVTRSPSRMLYGADVSVVRYSRGAGSARASVQAAASSAARTVVFIPGVYPMRVSTADDPFN
jgi:hypothetical protein